MAIYKKGRSARRQRTLTSALFSAWGLSLLLSIPLLLLMAALAYRSSDPRAGLSAYATIFTVILALSCGFFAARAYGKSATFVGLLSGAGIALVIVGIGLALSKDTEAIPMRLLCFALILLLGGIGGRLGGIKRSRRRRPR